jgi:hypothetical protein
MVTPTQLLHGSDGDLDLSLGLRLTPDLATYVQQKIDLRFSWFLGEWFLDQRLGLPYFRDIIGQRYDQRLCDSLFLRALQRVPGVGNVRACFTTFDAPSRTLRVDGEALLTTGEVVPIDFEIAP